MGIFPQKKATKGSQKWLQIIVNETPELLSGPIKSSFGLSPNLEIEWLSPIETNDFAEYRDEEFLEKFKEKCQALKCEFTFLKTSFASFKVKILFY